MRFNKAGTNPQGQSGEGYMAGQPRISDVQPAQMNDPAMLAELDRRRRMGTPRLESRAVRAHVTAVFWSFANSWRDAFHAGVADHVLAGESGFMAPGFETADAAASSKADPEYRARRASPRARVAE
jgi:hypothetical protein